MAKENDQIIDWLKKISNNEQKLSKLTPQLMQVLHQNGAVAKPATLYDPKNNDTDSLIKFKNSVKDINDHWHVLTRKNNFVASAFDNNGDYITLDRSHHYDLKFSGAQNVTTISQFLRIANSFKTACKSSRMLKDVRAYLHFNDNPKASESDEAKSNEATSMSASTKPDSESTASKVASQKSSVSASHSASSTSDSSNDSGNGITFSPD